MKFLFVLLCLLICAPVAWAEHLVTVGATSQMVDIFVSDSSSSTGAGLPSLTHSSGQTCYYHRDTANAAVQIPLIAGTLGTWTNSTTNYGWIAVDNTNMPGAYQISLPNAAIASGASSVLVMCKGATNMAPAVLRVILQADAPSSIGAIKAKTDNLPSDPADQSAVEAAISAGGGGGGNSKW